MKRSQRNKQQQERVVSPKFQEERKEKLAAKPILPLTEKQADYMREIKSKNLVIATGFSGSSKTFLPSSIAADMFYKGEVSKIILSRPAVSDARSVGFFSGSKNDKMMNWVMPMLDVLYQRLGKPVVDLAIAEGNIELVPLETIKGRSFSKDVFVICDEAEDCTIEEIKSIVTRNANCKMVICGDIEQSALKSDSGLKILLDILEKSPELEEYIGIVDFNEYSDIVRSKICKNMIIAFHKAGY